MARLIIPALMSAALIACALGFFFQAEDGIRAKLVTGVQTCALPIWERRAEGDGGEVRRRAEPGDPRALLFHRDASVGASRAQPAGRRPDKSAGEGAWEGDRKSVV